MFEAWDSDFIIYSGGIGADWADSIIPEIEKSRSHEKILFVLTTNGGAADEAFKVSRFLQETYGQHFTFGVVSYCKSAGTLATLGAKTIAMGTRGELGPLDVQLIRPDEINNRSSGLNLSQALDFIAEKSYSTFEDVFLKLKARSNGSITTKTASEIACSITTGIYSTIAQSIDAHQLGDMKRAVEVAYEYGVRLGARKDSVRRLVEGYPEHGFVIDLKEAATLFPQARPFSELESFLLKESQNLIVEQLGFDWIMSQCGVPGGLFLHIKPLFVDNSNNPDPHDHSDLPQDTAGQQSVAATEDPVGGGGSGGTSVNSGAEQVASEGPGDLDPPPAGRKPKSRKRDSAN